MSELVIGLTGGIGSGKTAVAELFRGHGAAIVDADGVAHELTAAQGAAMPLIEAEFGRAVIKADGSLDREAMRQLAFTDASARRRLEDILHPMIRRTCDQRCREASAAYAMLVVPLLVESGNYRQRVARLLVVDCPEETQIARAMARSQLSRAEVERIMAVQASRSQRLAAADDVIDNSGDRQQLSRQVAALHVKYAEMAGSG